MEAITRFANHRRKIPRDQTALEAFGSPARRKEPDAKDRRRPSLVINAFSNWAGLGVNILVGFLLTPFVIHHLGKGGYGIWTLIGSIVGYYGLLDLGVSSAVTRYVARYAAQGDDRALNKTVGTSLTVFLFAGLVMILVSVTAGKPLARFFDVSANNFTAFRYTLFFLGLGAAVNLVGQVFRASIAAYEYFVIRNCVIIATTIARAGLTVWALRLGFGLHGVAFSYMVAYSFALVANIMLCRILTPKIQVRYEYFRWPAIKTLFAFGLPSTVLAVSNVIRFNIDSVVIAKFISLEAVAIYAIAAILIRYFGQFIYSGVGVLTPRFSALDGMADYDSLRRIFLRSLLLSSIVSFAVAGILILFGSQLILIWVGESFLAASVPLYVLAASIAFGCAQAPSVNLMFAMNRHRFLAIVQSLEALANLVLSLCLAKPFGILGVAIGTALPMLVVKVLIQPLYVCRLLRITPQAQYLRISAGLAGMLIILLASF